MYKMEPITMDTTLGELAHATLLVAQIEEKTEEPKKRSKIDHDKIIALYKANWTVQKIVNELGCSVPTVVNTLKKEGLWKNAVQQED